MSTVPLNIVLNTFVTINTLHLTLNYTGINTSHINGRTHNRHFRSLEYVQWAGSRNKAR